MVEITSSLSVSAKVKDGRGSIDHEDNLKVGSTYFLTSTVLSLVTLFVFLYYFLVRRRSSWNKISPITPTDNGASEETEGVGAGSVGIWALFCKLQPLALTLAICFAVTMAFPVFTKVGIYIYLLQTTQTDHYLIRSFFEKSLFSASVRQNPALQSSNKSRLYHLVYYFGTPATYSVDCSRPPLASHSPLDHGISLSYLFIALFSSR